MSPNLERHEMPDRRGTRRASCLMETVNGDNDLARIRLSAAELACSWRNDIQARSGSSGHSSPRHIFERGIYFIATSSSRLDSDLSTRWRLRESMFVESRLSFPDRKSGVNGRCSRSPQGHPSRGGEPRGKNTLSPDGQAIAQTFSVVPNRVVPGPN
jgi:hypothetical protein